MDMNKENIKLCRICLQSDNKTYKSLFEFYKEVVIFEYINEISGLLISENDGFPDKICCTCLTELDVCINFKRKCELSNRILHKNFSTTDCPLSIKNEEIECEFQVDDSLDVTCKPFDYSVPSDISNTDINTTELLKCDDCGKAFKTKYNLRIHWDKSHNNKLLKCDICKRVFKNIYSYNKHRKVTSGPCFDLLKGIDIRVEGEGKSRMFFCKYCDYESNRMSIIRHHLVTHTGGKSFKCDVCEKDFNRSSTLATHRQTVHFKGACMKECHVCGKFYSGLRRLRKHLKIHSQVSYQCDECKIFVKTKQSLITHMLRHAGTKTFTCELCAASFYSSPELSNHRKRAHNTKGTYVKCSFCPFSAPEQKILNHSKKHNCIHKPHFCTKCGKFFATQDKLTKHETLHSDTKKYLCPICSQRFFRKGSIRKHVATKHNTSMSALKNSGILLVKKEFAQKEE